MMPPPSTRSFVTLAFASELAEDPALLAAYASVFGEDDDATLVLYAPGAEEAAVVKKITGAAASVGVDLERCADMAVLITAGDDGEDRLGTICHAVLSNNPESRLGEHPIYTAARVAGLRDLAEQVGKRSPSPRRWIDESLPGWMTRSELEVISGIAAEVPDHGVIIEIGSFAGRSSAHWAANSDPSVSIYCMDPFDAVVDDYSYQYIQGDAWDIRGRPCGELFAEYTSTWADRVTAVAEASPPPAWDLAGDVIFVDGDHSYEGVTRDLEFWIDQLKPAGRLLGHDWDDARVREAVHAFAAPRKMAVQVHQGTYVWELWTAGLALGARPS
jgi:hypothetical protein